MIRRNLSKIDFTGEEVGILKVVDRVKGTKSLWNCKCQCGNIVQVHASKLLSSERKSCGCLLKEIRGNFPNSHKTHGMTNTRLYKAYRSMMDRCYNPNIKNYENYGARGITVCEKWQEFIPFMEWALANGYDEKKDRLAQSLDRIDINGNYEPNNCRWANSKIQSKNKRNVDIVYYNGEELTISEICDMFGITDKSFAYRRFKDGKSIESIIEDWNEKEIIPDYLMECSEYAIQIGVCTAHVRRMIHQGKLQGEKRGRKWYVVRK